MDKNLIRVVCLAVICLSASLSICGQSVSSPKVQTPKSIFVFHTNEFWLNLHHFLYVLARAENKEKDSLREAVANAPADQESKLVKLSAAEKQTWRKAIAWYVSGPARKDLVFDDPLPAVTNALARSENAVSLKGSDVDASFATILESAAAIYRKAWWKQHQAANEKWQKTTERLVNLHGVRVLSVITNAYQMQWPVAGFPVHVSAYSNWAGAYSTKGNLLVLASLDRNLQGEYGLETVFHEGMHQWDEQIQDALIEVAQKINKYFPRGLSHALIFFTAGEAVRSVNPVHVPYAEKSGVWQRGLSQFRVALDETWKPYLDGHGTRDEAFAELIKRTAVKPNPD
ncbi:MAG TPA: hypothetical protein VGQ41_26840 [Pyrinomonadaceae bacterium]|nr:hypothetical protein [Pyrinomonadaceae bacterium]